ncbi:uncharacterized protein LOC114532541 [Dendronephthya gigantea]|uniref:uncharacterized protein LOC114532541 n=1 Tax=Dendronephthya gigantea TaxID=151771 RepID=UPI00106AB022|nr:uncharacterized protein LOC114532541 [Dendronephthya gigantea]
MEISDELKHEHCALIIEKAELERNIERRQQKIKRLLIDIKSSYQMCAEQEAKDALLTLDGEESWEPEIRAFELWSSGENVEEMQGIIVALKRKRAAITAECSDILSKLEDLRKTSL